MVTQPKRFKPDHDGASIDSLSWDNPVHLIGEKVNDPDLLNCCMLCNLPILVYGRLIPCKHVLCLDCAHNHSATICAKCGDKVTRVEQCQLGTVFVCSYGSARHIHGGCKRTYLSYRDMEAHVKHRHRKKPEPVAMATSQQQQPIVSQSAVIAGGQYSVPPTIISGHLMHHQSPAMAPNTSMPPPGIPIVSHQHHPIRPAMQARPRQSGPVVIPPTATSIPPNAVRHSMPPSHVMHHVRPQAVTMRQHNQAAPSKSHGNLISIPIQGASDDASYNNWVPQQQWSSGRSGSHIQRQGKNYSS